MVEIRIKKKKPTFVPVEIPEREVIIKIGVIKPVFKPIEKHLLEAPPIIKSLRAMAPKIRILTEAEKEEILRKYGPLRIKIKRPKFSPIE